MKKSSFVKKFKNRSRSNSKERDKFKDRNNSQCRNKSRESYQLKHEYKNGKKLLIYAFIFRKNSYVILYYFKKNLVK